MLINKGIKLIISLYWISKMTKIVTFVGVTIVCEIHLRNIIQLNGFFFLSILGNKIVSEEEYTTLHFEIWFYTHSDQNIIQFK